LSGGKKTSTQIRFSYRKIAVTPIATPTAAGRMLPPHILATKINRGGKGKATMGQDNQSRLKGALAVVLITGSAAFISSIVPLRAEESGNACERYLHRYSEREKVPLGVLYAVGMTETGKGGKLHPFALNIEGKSVIATSKRDALRTFHEASKRGKKLIDLGCMQVNHHYHGRNFKSVEAMLDPETNIAYSALFLRRLYDSYGSWTVAVARYHASPRNKPAQKRYICSVIRNLVASGFGAWTVESESFCRAR
jgi:soluble lytic murein transglycosylase-like protein